MPEWNELPTSGGYITIGVGVGAASPMASGSSVVVVDVVVVDEVVGASVVVVVVVVVVSASSLSSSLQLANASPTATVNRKMAKEQDRRGVGMP